MPKKDALQVSAPADNAIDALDPREFILIKNARVHNLKNLSVALPRNQFIVVTGLSGSGKSSLAFDTLYAEGQRMYVESLSSYARQFLGRMDKPDVDYIRGISPAIAIEQKVSIKNNRSTVGTSTEIYDYLKLLFARVGRTYSPVSGEQVRKDNVADVVDFLEAQPEGTRAMILAPLHRADKSRAMSKELDLLLQKGYSRVVVDGVTSQIEDLLAEGQPEVTGDVYIMIDRAVLRPGDEDLLFRLSDSVQTAFFEGHGNCIVQLTMSSEQLAIADSQDPKSPSPQVPREERRTFSDKFELDGMTFEEPSVNFFSFNNPYGACQTCEGFGSVLGIDEDLVIPDKSLTVYEGAIAPWRTEKQGEWLKPLLKNGIRFDFPIHRPYNELSAAEQRLLWTGNKHFQGLDAYFKWVSEQTHKIQYRVLQSRYRGRTTCPDCRGTRLRKDAQYVKIDGRSIADLVLLPISEALKFFENLTLSEHEQKVADRLVTEITNRLGYLNRVGLGYLTLNRLSNTLSGGESQRISLATSLGSALVGSMYVLDEPSIGLHPKDAEQLIGVLRSLQQLGNTVVVVEHEEKMMEAADQIIDIGPEAGSGGGNLMFQGTMQELLQDTTTYTGQYLSGRLDVPVPAVRRPWRNALELTGARENNLKNVSVKLPLNVMTVVTGVSGSGKSTLIKRILAPALMKMLGGGAGEATGKFDRLTGVNGQVTHVEFVDQNPIGKSSRSNPVTYVKAYDQIRTLFSEQPLAKARGLKPSHFSFNVDGGRCEVCQGEGQVKIEMQFMADIYLTCEGCGGHKFKQDILEIKFQDKGIDEVLEMTVSDAVQFFQGQPKVAERLKPLEDVGLGYIRLGQSANTLSGGEAQRVKLASFLTKGATLQQDKILFIFDEPSTGLHFHDIAKLVGALNALIEQGNSVLIIEHNVDIIKCADWIIDLGPEGGINGGHLLFEGTPEEMVKLKDTNHTARFLAEKV